MNQLLVLVGIVLLIALTTKSGDNLVKSVSKGVSKTVSKPGQVFPVLLVVVVVCVLMCMNKRPILEGLNPGDPGCSIPNFMSAGQAIQSSCPATAPSGGESEACCTGVTNFIDQLDCMGGSARHMTESISTLLGGSNSRTLGALVGSCAPEPASASTSETVHECTSGNNKCTCWNPALTVVDPVTNRERPQGIEQGFEVRSGQALKIMDAGFVCIGKE